MVSVTETPPPVAIGHPLTHTWNASRANKHMSKYHTRYSYSVDVEISYFYSVDVIALPAVNRKQFVDHCCCHCCSLLQLFVPFADNRSLTCYRSILFLPRHVWLTELTLNNLRNMVENKYRSFCNISRCIPATTGTARFTFCSFPRRDEVIRWQPQKHVGKC